MPSLSIIDRFQQRCQFHQPASSADKVSVGLVDMYFSQVTLLKAGNIAAVLMVVLIAWDTVKPLLLISWLCLHLLIAGAELLAAQVFKHQPMRFRPQVWLWLLIPPTLMSGILWGAVAVLFVDSSNAIHVVMVSILILGILGGALYTLSLLPPLFQLFCMLVLVQYAWVVYATPYALPFLAGVILLAMFFMGLSYVLFDTMRSLLRSRDKNEIYARELQVAKEQAERAYTAKAHFLAAASHDIRQPLHAMALYIESLCHRINLLPIDDAHDLIHSTREPLSGLHAAHAAMSKIMNTLLDISRLEAGVITPQLEAVSITSIMDQLIDSYQVVAMQKGLSLRTRIADVVVRSDMDLLARITMNLLSNAVRYTDQGGILITCRISAGSVCLDFWDTGIGIPESEQEAVFEEFYRFKQTDKEQESGLGLGLACVRGMVQLLPEHQIELCSRPGQGSRFRLKLGQPQPARLQPLTSTERGCEFMGDDFRGLHLLIVEDDAEVSRAIQSMLAAWGCHIRIASNIIEAQMHAQQCAPDAVIADFRLSHLSEDETGIQAIAAVRAASQHHIPALIITAENRPETLQDIKRHDVFLLYKPIQAGRLRLFLKQCQSDTMQPA